MFSHNPLRSLWVILISVLFLGGCAVTYSPPSAGTTHVWAQVSKSEWVYYDGHHTTTATLRGNTLLFYRTTPCPRGTRNVQSTLGWVAGDRLSYAATDCNDRRLVSDVTNFDQSWFIDSLPSFVRVAYFETKVARRNR